jgi:hypothetical protein
MAGEFHKDAVLRLFRLAAQVQRDGLKLDGRDPAWRSLCNHPDLASMSDDEMKDRLRELALVASEYVC